MPAKFEDIIITAEILNTQPSAYFVYGDNLQKQGLGGAAALRHHPRAIGFITKKAPDHLAKSSFKPDEYVKLFFDQLENLSTRIRSNPQQTYYISKLGAGLANKYYIWETVIRHNLLDELAAFDNVVFCWPEKEEDLTSR